MPFDDQISLAAPSGANVNIHIKRGRQPARGVVQVNHGLAEHGARYARFADFLAGHGFHTYAHDHRGHAYTTAPGTTLGHAGSETAADNLIADVAAVHDLIQSEHRDLPVIVFGHSMGGMVALNFVQRYPERVAAAAIWNASYPGALAGRAAQAVLAWERLRLGSDVPSRIIPRLTFQAWAKQMPEPRTAFDWLSRDAAEVDKYVADPLCGWDASVGTWRALFDLIFFASDDGNFGRIAKDMPIQLVGGADDPATEGGKQVRALEQRMRRLGFSNLETRIYAETRHESLSEVNRDDVMADFLAWAESVLPKP